MTLHHEEMKNIESSEAERKTALIVNDTPNYLDICKDFLEFRGYDVVTAISAEEAMKYKDKNFDIVIIDSLDGKCFKVYDSIKAKRKVIHSGDEEIIELAKEKGQEVKEKGQNSLQEILENEK